jgi:hypothetical protein
MEHTSLRRGEPDREGGATPGRRGWPAARSIRPFREAKKFGRKFGVCRNWGGSWGEAEQGEHDRRCCSVDWDSCRRIYSPQTNLERLYSFALSPLSSHKLFRELFSDSHTDPNKSGRL